MQAKAVIEANGRRERRGELTNYFSHTNFFVVLPDIYFKTKQSNQRIKHLDLNLDHVLKSRKSELLIA